VGLRDLVAAVLAPVTASARAVAMFLVTALLATVGLVLARRDDRPDVLRRGYLMVGATLLLLPTSLHPWYVIWILPFLCLYPAVGWLYFSGAVALSYVKYLREPQVLPLGIRLLEFLPLVLLLGAQAAWQRRAPTEAPRAMKPMMEKP
jgi:Ca2+/Na+ antiporter